MRHVAIPEDRTIAVEPGYRVLTGYVPIHHVRLACRDRMAVGDVEAAYRRQLCLGARQAFPPPFGYWGGEWFVILDGRHAYVSAVMHGFDHLLVAWLDDA